MQKHMVEMNQINRQMKTAAPPPDPLSPFFVKKLNPADLSGPTSPAIPNQNP
jgi:hypothetical protein